MDRLQMYPVKHNAHFIANKKTIKCQRTILNVFFYKFFKMEKFSDTSSMQQMSCEYYDLGKHCMHKIDNGALVIASMK